MPTDAKKSDPIVYGMQLAAKVFANRGKGQNTEIHIDRTELAAFLALAFREGQEDNAD